MPLSPALLLRRHDGPDGDTKCPYARRAGVSPCRRDGFLAQETGSGSRNTPRWCQRVVAFVKRKQPVEAQALDEHCVHSDLANFKRPREYVFVREIPKSPVGKILRRKLSAGEFEADGTPEPLPPRSL